MEVHQAPAPLRGHQADNALRVLVIMFLANLLNVYDRLIPAVLGERLRIAFALTDFQLGLIGSGFTIVYALSSIPLGRLADLGSRKVVIGVGLVVWSAFTAMTGFANGFVSFLILRMGVGIGEASYAPAAHSLISDLFPSERRSRAVGFFMLGLPLGAVAAFITVGQIAVAFDSWRAPFYFATVPGLILAMAFFMMREPVRGASDAKITQLLTPVAKPIRKILRVRTMWWLIIAGLGGTFAAYGANGFMMPLYQRYFHLDLKTAGLLSGLLLGVSGVIGLAIVGPLADRMQKQSPNGRMVLGTGGMTLCSLFILAGLIAKDVTVFSWLMGIGFLIGNVQAVCIYPAVQELVPPQLRATATAIFMASMYLLGGAFGTVAVGGLSDFIADAARAADNAATLTENHRALGLHGAMYLVPLSLFVGAFAMWRASKSYLADVSTASRLLDDPPLDTAAILSVHAK
ncbi:Sugar phosphate permease [Duganella sp. CF402]|nr:sugar phosphate permease [Duganella sp. BK701]SEM02816.1 Sugar phosphate permease [Duganella sp. CF402]